MAEWQCKRPVVVVTAYVKRDGFPDFALTEVEVTEDEHANGVHYNLVETILADRSIDANFIHFDEQEAPPFLLPAVRKHVEDLRTASSAAAEPEPALPF